METNISNTHAIVFTNQIFRYFEPRVMDSFGQSKIFIFYLGN